MARYRLGALLGRGGMAEVYDGYDERLHRAVAVKLLRPDMAADPDVRSRFEVEARSAARLSHPNVVAVFDTGEDSGTPFIVMERLPGETLADRMATGPAEQSWLRRVAGDVLGALGAAHAAGLVHRDVKPGNILIAENGCAKVADFGIAKSVEVVGDLTGTGLLVGTPAYLAPERLDGRAATEQSDLYALGVVLYEALAGAKPFAGATSVATAHAVMNADPRPLLEARPDVDPRLAAAIERAMAKDPAARPRSAREMATDLGTDPADSPPPTPEPTVTMAGGVATADATVVGAPTLAPAPGRGRAPAGEGVGGRWRRAAAGGGLLGAGRPSTRQLGLLAVAAMILVALLVAVTGNRGSDGGAGPDGLTAGIRSLAGRLESGDGVKGPEAAERLEKIADQVEAGGGADEANSLLRDAGTWNGQGQLSGAATTAMAAVLGRIDGVDRSLVTTTTTTTAPPTTPVPAPGDGDGDEEDGDRGKRKGKGRDD